jgi:hypothetical protein
MMSSLVKGKGRWVVRLKGGNIVVVGSGSAGRPPHVKSGAVNRNSLVRIRCWAMGSGYFLTHKILETVLKRQWRF